MNRIRKLLIYYRVLEVLQTSSIGICGLFFNISMSDYKNISLFMGALFLHTLSAFLINDFSDWKSDGKAGEPLAFNINLSIVSMLASVLIGFAISLELGVCFILMNILSIVYSCPPFRFKIVKPMPILIHFVMGQLYFISGSFVSSINFNSSQVILMFSFGLILASGSLANEINDRQSDALADIRTLGQMIPIHYEKLVIFIFHILILFLFLLYSFIEQKKLIFLVFLGLTCYVFVYRFMAESTFRRFRNFYRIFFSVLVLIITCANIIKKFT